MNFEVFLIVVCGCAWFAGFVFLVDCSIERSAWWFVAVALYLALSASIAVERSERQEARRVPAEASDVTR